MAKTYNIFISHSWTYSGAYDGLVALLRARPYFGWKDYSVPKDDPIHDAENDSALYEAITRQMTPCHIVLILGGVYSTYSRWIKKEIQIAQREFQSPKPIIGIRPRGQANISSEVQVAAEEIVSWNSDSIVEAIRRHAI